MPVEEKYLVRCELPETCVNRSTSSLAVLLSFTLSHPDYLLQNRRMSEADARKKFRQIVLAVDYCHQQGIVHRDLKVCFARSLSRARGACRDSTATTFFFLLPMLFLTEGLIDFVVSIWCWPLWTFSSHLCSFPTCYIPMSLELLWPAPQLCIAVCAYTFPAAGQWCHSAVGWKCNQHMLGQIGAKDLEVSWLGFKEDLPRMLPLTCAPC